MSRYKPRQRVQLLYDNLEAPTASYFSYSLRSSTTGRPEIIASRLSRISRISSNRFRMWTASRALWWSRARVSVIMDVCVCVYMLSPMKWSNGRAFWCTSYRRRAASVSLKEPGFTRSIATLNLASTTAIRLKISELAVPDMSTLMDLGASF